MAAHYECTIPMTDAETFLFTVKPRTPAGEAPVWADYVLEYALNGNGVSLLLTEGDGIEVDTGNGIVTIGPEDRDYRLPVGEYKHGFRMKDTVSGVTIQFFDGTVSVSEGNFS